MVIDNLTKKGLIELGKDGFATMMLLDSLELIAERNGLNLDDLVDTASEVSTKYKELLST